MPSAADLAADPAWFPTHLSADYARIGFARLGAAHLRAQPFLDARGVPAGAERAEIAASELAPYFNAPAIPPAIFHSAFCCSTLLASALDAPGTCLALKEPNVLMDLANARRMLPRRGKGDDYAPLFRVVTTLLAREHAPGERVLVKPTNAANNMLSDWAAARGRIFLIYSSLQDFLVSLLKKGEDSRAFFRRQFNIFTLDMSGLSRIPDRQAIALTDLQIAALVWRHQLELFSGLTAPRPLREVGTDDRSFLADPAGVLSRAARALGLEHSREEIMRTVNGPVFARDAKDPERSLSPEGRGAASAEVRRLYGDALETVGPWAMKTELDGPVRL